MNQDRQDNVVELFPRRLELFPSSAHITIPQEGQAPVRLHTMLQLNDGPPHHATSGWLPPEPGGHFDMTTWEHVRADGTVESIWDYADRVGFWSEDSTFWDRG